MDGLGLRVRRLRDRVGMSQAQLAHQLGRSERWLRKIEAGETTPNVRELDGLAALLHVEVSVILALAPIAAAAKSVPHAAPLLAAGLLDRPDDLGGAVARLRTAYPQSAPLAMLSDVETGLAQARSLVAAGLSRRAHRDVLGAAAWLHLLAGTARFDLFDRPAAGLYRSEAERLAREIGDSELLGWTYETAAHFALVDGDLRDAVRYARAAQHAAPIRSVAALASHLQEARCWAQLGSPEDAMTALGRASDIFERQSEAGSPGDHYSFDTAKFGFFAATTYAEVGRTLEAERMARSVVATCGHRPNTAANARVTLALALVQRGELDEAAHEAASALAAPRVHPDTLRRAREVGRFLAPHAEVASVQGLQARLAALARQSVHGGIE